MLLSTTFRNQLIETAMLIELTALWMMQLAAPAPAPAPDWAITPASACVATQSYQTAGGPLTIGLRLPPLSDEAITELLLVQNGPEPENIANFAIAAPGEEPTQKSVSTLPLTQGRWMLLSHIDKGLFDRIVASGKIRLRIDQRKLAVELGNIADAIGAMQRCNQERLRALNIDPEALRLVVTAPEVTDKGFLDRINYPKNFEFPKGNVQTLLTIDLQGKVVKCQIWLSSGDQAVEASICAAMRTVRFKPGKDVNGQAITSYALYTFVYRLTP